MTTRAAGPSRDATHDPAQVFLEGLDEFQRAAVTAPLGPVAIIAGPGSGKTRTLVARIGHLVAQGEAEAEHVVALTHTQKAAGELRGRLDAAGVDGPLCATFHAVAWRQVREMWTASGRSGTPELMASGWGMVRDCAARVLGRAQVGDPSVVSDIISEIEWAHANGLTPRRYVRAAAAAGRACSIDAVHIPKIWSAYVTAKEAAGVIDFGDVLAIAADMLDDPDIATQVRDRWRTFFVDEYQDVDLAQQRLLEAWLGERDSLCVVGDPEQSVFRFKGAEPALLVDFAARWPGAQVVHLLSNYRSSGEIVEWVNALTVRDRPALVAHVSGPVPRALAFDHEAAEERALVRELTRWHRAGVPFAEMAVLYRFNAAAARLESALTAAQIPYHVSGTTRFFERPEVRGVLVPFGQQARADGDRDGVALFDAAARATGFDPDAPPAGMGPARQRWETIAALVEMVTDRFAGASAAEVLAGLQDRARAQHDLTPGGVTLATVHAAKGLEWECVWVAGVTEGQLPSTYAKTPEDLDQEQHLMYVAVSRAKRELVVSHATKRHNGWRASPSRYLDLLTGTGSATGSPRRGAHSSTRARTGAASLPTRGLGDLPPLSVCERCGSRLTSLAGRRSRRCGAACLSGEDAVRYRRLVAWRAERAEALGVVPAKVVTDRGLFSVAVLKTTDGIAGISAQAGEVPLD